MLVLALLLALMLLLVSLMFEADGCDDDIYDGDYATAADAAILMIMSMLMTMMMTLAKANHLLNRLNFVINRPLWRLFVEIRAA